MPNAVGSSREAGPEESPATETFLSLPNLASASESRFDGARGCPVAGLQTRETRLLLPPPGRIKLRLTSQWNASLKCWPGGGEGEACTRPGPNTLLGRPTLFEFRGKLKESFRATRADWRPKRGRNAKIGESSVLCRREEGEEDKV